MEWNKVTVQSPRSPDSPFGTVSVTEMQLDAAPIWSSVTAALPPDCQLLVRMTVA